MRKKWITALVLGLSAGGLHLLYVRDLDARARGGEDVEVLVAATRVVKGDLLTEQRVAVRAVPVAYVDERVVKRERAKEIAGAKVAVDLEAGQMVQWTDFQLRLDSGKENIADLVESGQRAMTIPVDGSLSMGGLLRPGHRVDIIGTFSKGKQRSDKVTVTMLQNVTVLACGKEIESESGDREKSSFRTVTLSVTVEEGELLAFASSQGSLSVVLRGHQDLTVIDDIPEKGWEDVWEASRRNALQEKSRGKGVAIERIEIR